MSKHLILVGAGHAHMTVMLRLRDYVEAGHRVTVVSPSPYQYYSGMGPGMLSGIYRPQEARFHVRKMIEDRGGTFLRDRVIRVEPDRRRVQLEGGQALEYDVASFNTGSHVPAQSLMADQPSGVYPVKPVINLLKAGRLLAESMADRPPRVVVVGGGPAGVEVAGNAWRRFADAGVEPRITLIGGRGLLNRLPERAGRLARESLAERGIDILSGKAVRKISASKVTLEDGEVLASDLTLIATGTRPSSLFKDSGLQVGADDGLLVNAFLQSVDFPEIFGGGDCVTLRGADVAKVGVYAVRQNPVLHNNLLAVLSGGRMKPFEPQAHYLLVLNMGDGTGVLTKYGIALDGRLMFRFKNHLDRSFMGRFQVSGELEEPFDESELEGGR